MGDTSREGRVELHPYFTQLYARNRTPCSEPMLFWRERSFQCPERPEPVNIYPPRILPPRKTSSPQKASLAAFLGSGMVLPPGARSMSCYGIRPSDPSKKHPTCHVTIREQTLPRDLPLRTVFTTLAYSGYQAYKFQAVSLHPLAAPSRAERVRTRFVQGS